ncbi:MAG: aspartyl protease family protein, partial [Bdellovibrionales bacterium]|nr:aspartyl protease family protein [Bdellovibrionales bacterium]
MKFLFLFSYLILLTSCSSMDKTASDEVDEVSFQYFDNRILLPIEINGKGPFYMVFDTGGSNMLMPDAVRRLGLETKDAGFGGGAGDAQIPMQSTKVESYKVGNINMTNQDFLIMDLSPIKKAFGFENLDGIIGYELLQ